MPDVAGPVSSSCRGEYAMGNRIRDTGRRDETGDGIPDCGYETTGESDLVPPTWYPEAGIPFPVS